MGRFVFCLLVLFVTNYFFLTLTFVVEKLAEQARLVRNLSTGSLANNVDLFGPLWTTTRSKCWRFVYEDPQQKFFAHFVHGKY